MKNRILLVEDEIPVATIIKDYLQQAEFSVEVMHSGAGVIEAVRISPPHLILLDIMLPQVDGITLCREIRNFSDVPVIMLTAKIMENDRLLGYDLGADDYICKPVKPREILARVKAVLNRYDSIPTTTDDFLVMREDQLLALYQGKRLELTQAEFRLLNCLYQNEGTILSRKEIKKRAFRNQNETSDRVVDTLIKVIRNKINQLGGGENPIRSVYGVGYKFERPGFVSSIEKSLAPAK